MSEASRQLLRRVVITALLALAAGMLWYSSTIKGEPTEPTQTDAAVEQLIPARDAPSVLAQSEIGIDLGPGWDADLVIDGQVIPEDEENDVPALNRVTFTPGEGKTIERLRPGKIEVIAIIWRPVAGESRERGSRAVRWSFRSA